MLLVVVKVIVKIIIQRIKEHLESLIDREQASFFSSIFYIVILKTHPTKISDKL